MSRVLFSTAARADRDEISRYTSGHFGIEQARRLRDLLRQAIETLATAPLLGRIAEELDPPGHAFRYFVVARRIVIVYRPMDDGIQVARILHGARDIAVELDRDPGDR